MGCGGVWRYLYRLDRDLAERFSERFVENKETKMKITANNKSITLSNPTSPR